MSSLSFKLVMMALALNATIALAGENGSIDLFPFGVDPTTGSATTVDFGQCQGTPVPIFGGFGQKLVLGVFARLNGVSLQGIAGAEMFVEGIETLPGVGTEWLVSVEYPGSAVPGEGISAIYETRNVAGSLVRRQILIWSSVTGPDAPNCQKGALTEIARISLMNTGSPAATIPEDWRIRVIAGDPPSNPNFNCPLILLCNYPEFTLYCVTGGEFIINPVQTSCTVAVSAATWGSVKALYR